MQVQDLSLVYQTYYERLVFFCVKITNDRELSRDIVQDAFIRYYQRAGTIADHETAVKNFLYSTVHNAALNVIRHNKVIEGYAGQQDKKEPQEASIMELIINTEVIAEIHNAIASLPDQYRIIAKLGYFEGKKNQEIADELGMSVNTIKKQKQRMLELLNLRLAPELFALILFVLN